MKRIEYKEVLEPQSGQGKKSIKRNGNILLFSMLSTIADHMVISSSVTYIVLIFLETCQILYFPLFTLQNHDEALHMVAFALTVVNYPLFLLNTIGSGGWIMFLVVWIIHAVVCSMVMACVVILACCVVHSTVRRTDIVQIVASILSVGLTVLNTVLLLPLLETTMFPMLCVQGAHLYQSNGTAYIDCGSPLQITLSVFSGIFLLAIVVVQFLVMHFFVENAYRSHLPWAGDSPEVFALHGLVAFATSLYLAIDINGVFVDYAVAVGWVLQMLVVYKRVMAGRFMYHEEVQLARTVQETILCAADTYVCLHLLYSSKSSLVGFAGALGTGACLGILVHAWKRLKRGQMLSYDYKDLKFIKSVEDYVKVLVAYCVQGVDTLEWNSVAQFLLRLHVQDCTKSSCICRNLSNPNIFRGLETEVVQTVTPEVSDETHEQSNKVQSERERQRQQKRTKKFYYFLIETILEEAAAKWERSKCILLEAAYYDAFVLKNYFKSYYWVVKAEQLPGTWSDWYHSYRMKHILARYIVLKESKNEGSEKLQQMVQFQKLCTAFQQAMRDTTTTVLSFWKLFDGARLNVGEFFSKAQRITLLLRLVALIFKHCSELYPDYPTLYHYYANFMRLVVNREEEAKELAGKQEIGEQRRRGKERQAEDISTVPDSGVVLVSGNLNTLGTILNANQHVKEQLGFSVGDLVGRNVSRIMPRIIGERHDSFMLRHLQTGASIVLGYERLIFIQTKDGTLEATCILVKTLPGLEHGIRYVGFLRSDMRKISTHYVKVPSQYTSHQLAFIVADGNNIVLGLSQQACTLLGLSSDYIRRKKGFTSLRFPMQDFAKELGDPTFETQLLTGMSLQLNTSCVLEYLDYDYLTREEEDSVKAAVKERKPVYIVLMKVSFHNEVSLRIYAVIDLSAWKRTRTVFATGMAFQREAQLAAARRRDSTNRAELETSQIQSQEMHQSFNAEPLSHQPTAGPQVDQDRKASNTQTNGQEVDIADSNSVRRLKIAIVVFILVVLACMVLEAVLMLFYMGDAIHLHKVIEHTYRKLVFFNISIYKLLAYMNIANYLEPESTAFSKNRTVLLVVETDQYLDLFKKSEINFEEALAKSAVSSLASEVLYTPLTIRKIRSDFVLYYEQQTLNYVTLELITKGSELIHNTKKGVESVHFLNGYIPTNPQDRLTPLERGIYFLFANSLFNVHEHVSLSGEKIYAETQNLMESHKLTLFWIHVGTYGVICIFGIVFIPIIVYIQRSKWRLLLDFAELTGSEAKTLEDNCKQFLKVHLASLSRQGEDGLDEEARKKDSLQLRVASDMHMQIPVLMQPEGTQSAAKQSEDKDKDNNRAKFKAPTESEATQQEEEEAPTLLKKEQEVMEDEQVKERKKRIQRVTVTLGYVTWVIVGIFTLVMGYYAKILYSVFDNYSGIKENLHGTLCIHKRFFYLSSTLLYYRSYLKSFSKFHYTVEGQDPYEHFFDLTLKNEEATREFKVYSPSGMKPIADLMQKYDSRDFCTTALPLLKTITLTWCQTISNGVLNEGLERSISSFLTRTRNKYAALTMSRNSEQLKLEEMLSHEFVLWILTFLNVYNPVFEYLQDYSDQVFEEYVTQMLSFVIVDYVIIFATVIISFIVMMGYIAGSIENEIATERGMLTLFPAEVHLRIQKLVATSRK